MEYEIVWSEPAGLQLQEVHDYIAADNPAAATRVVSAIISRVDQLAATPRLGVVFHKGGKYPIRKIISGKYRIFFRIVEEEKRVEILLIWHGARRDPDLRKYDET